MPTLEDHWEEIRRRIHRCGLTIKSESTISDGTGYQFRTVEGPIVNAYHNGTIVRQGKRKELLDLEFGLDTASATHNGSPRKVFVVYGHDREARDQLEAILRRWKIEPLILDQLPSEGQTLIEKLERYRSEASFAVVLATPDDVGYPVGKDDEKAHRARQNVVLELGMVLALLGRPKVAILVRNSVEMERPSDIQGLIYIPFVDHVNDAGLLLAKEMNKQGLKIDLGAI